MTSNVALHPALEYFYSQFKEKEPEPSGILAGNMDKFNITQKLNMQGGYIVCAEKIKFTVSEEISCQGPRGSFIGGKV